MVRPTCLRGGWDTGGVPDEHRPQETHRGGHAARCDQPGVARETSIRHGHPSTLHLWWARRPLAAFRTVLVGHLVDDPSAWPERFADEDARDEAVLAEDVDPETVRAAFQLIHRVIDEIRGEDEGQFDRDTRFALTRFESYDFAPGPYGDAEPLAKARSVSVSGVQESGVLHAAAGKTVAPDPAEGARSATILSAPGPDAAAPMPIPSPRRPRVFVGSVEFDGLRVGKGVGRVPDEVLAHRAARPGSQVDVTLEIHVRIPEGIDDGAVCIVGQNAATSRFDHASFEDE